MSKSKSAWGVLVTAFFTVGVAIAPIKDAWRTPLFCFTAVLFLCACVGWLIADRKAKILRGKLPPLVPNWAAATILALTFALSSFAFYRSLNGPPTTAQWESEYGHLETISDRHFESQEVVLDGKQFQDCTFDRVTFIFNGRHMFLLAHNHITGPIRVKVSNGAPFTAARLVWEVFAEICLQSKTEDHQAQQWNCPISGLIVRPTEETDYIKDTLLRP